MEYTVDLSAHMPMGMYHAIDTFNPLSEDVQCTLKLFKTAETGSYAKLRRCDELIRHRTINMYALHASMYVCIMHACTLESATYIRM
jgi:hypothetical protein